MSCSSERSRISSRSCVDFFSSYHDMIMIACRRRSSIFSPCPPIQLMNFDARSPGRSSSVMLYSRSFSIVRMVYSIIRVESDNQNHICSVDEVSDDNTPHVMYERVHFFPHDFDTTTHIGANFGDSVAIHDTKP